MPDELELVMDIETLEIFEVKYHLQVSKSTKDNDRESKPDLSEETAAEAGLVFNSFEETVIAKAAPVQLNLFDSLKSMTDLTYTNSS